MRLEPSDPDIETIVTRIERKDLDLQPEFQRGEVWSKAKKQRLIDSILREWHIPPVHVIELLESRKQEVLDGQQRLAAIRDFVRGEFVIDGEIPPTDTDIAALAGKRYRDLPDDWKRRFNQFTIRVFRIVDYRTEEPAELFFRLNQPSSLTAAEQRNAFFGPVREQIKKLVLELEVRGVDKRVLGFSNSRMAYDDVLARVCLTVRRKSVSEKITASDLVDLYRSNEPLPPESTQQVQQAIELVGGAQSALQGHVQLNKATVYSWFLFIIRAHSVWSVVLRPETFGRFVAWFERRRSASAVSIADAASNGRAILSQDLLRIYADRSTSRVADVSSVILRDAIIWLGFEQFMSEEAPEAGFPIGSARLEKIHTAYAKVGSPIEDDVLARELITNDWGVLE